MAKHKSLQKHGLWRFFRHIRGEPPKGGTTSGCLRGVQRGGWMLNFAANALRGEAPAA
jgi:hypothetical protein